MRTTMILIVAVATVVALGCAGRALERPDGCAASASHHVLKHAAAGRTATCVSAPWLPVGGIETVDLPDDNMPGGLAKAGVFSLACSWCAADAAGMQAVSSFIVSIDHPPHVVA